MTVREMQKGVQQQLQRMEIPLESEDTIYYLNRAVEQYIEEQYVFLRGKYTDQGNIELYNSSQRAIENLRSLITTEVVTNPSIGQPLIMDVAHFYNAKKIELESLEEEFYFYIRSQTQIEEDGLWVNNKLIEQDSVQKFIQTRDNIPIFRNYLILLEGDLLYVFYDTQEFTGVHSLALTFIRKPKELVITSPQINQTTTCELPIHTHQTIVNIAVVLINNDWQGNNPRLQESGQ